MTEGTILILNANAEEKGLLQRICSTMGTVHSASNLPGAISYLESMNFHVLVVDSRFASYSSLKGLVKRTTSIIITGKEEKELKDLLRDWPHNRYIDYRISPLFETKDDSFLRALRTAIDHSLLKTEVYSLQRTVERTEMELRDAYSEIKEIKNVINESVIKELEKRIEMEAKYIWFKREKKKIEDILKNLYTANDVTNLLDIVHDIKDIIRARGISLYILEQSNALGKYLKPLVWDNAFLSHPEFSKHVVLLDAQDFAASVARYGQEINTKELTYDARLSKRYVEQLKIPLRNILSVPLMHDRQVIGVLEVYNKIQAKNAKPQGFSEEDQQILRTLTEHIAIAITKLNLIQYDALTGLLRPEPFFEKVIQEIKSPRKRRQEEASYALVMGDVDWFKNYNDRNGHEAGNRLLRDLANILKASTREGDLLCRYGGEEFLFFLSGTKSVEEACRITERIRKTVEEHYFEYQEYQPRNNMTMSFGLTYFTPENIESLDLITKNDLKKLANEADIALAEAKGKNAKALESHQKEDTSPPKNKVCVYYRKDVEELSKEGMIRPYQERFIQERRKYERFYTSTILIYRRENSHKVTKTINLSLGGAKISSDLKLPSAQTLDLILILGSKARQLKGEVIYSEKAKGEFLRYHSGLKFVDLSFEDRKVLEDYFASLQMKESSPLTH
jgi:diguanylate cyclase (GGDEF)-like protein